MTPLTIVLIVLAAIIVAVLFLYIARWGKRDASRDRSNQPSDSRQLFVNRYRDLHINVQPINDGHGSYRVQVPYQFVGFKPSTDEVIFYAPSQGYLIESLIQDHFDEINALFNDKNKAFVFLPVFNQKIKSAINASLITYYKPGISSIPTIPDNYLSYQDILTASQIPNVINKPSLLRCIRYDTYCAIFTVRQLISQDLESLKSEIQDYSTHIGKGLYYSIVSPEKLKASLAGMDADDRFDTDVYLIGQEIRERIDQLRSRGLSTLAIRKLIGDDSDKPSRLHIDSKYQIILPDFDNKQINLSPIHKAVFFLFLRHPEGIYFKNLSDCRDELSFIYKHITGREDLSAVEESIDRLTNPLDNSINEKCARIRNAFVSEFREELADVISKYIFDIFSQSCFDTSVVLFATHLS